MLVARLGPLRVNVPKRYTKPVSVARNSIYLVALRSPESLVKQLEAIAVRNKGERPKRAMLMPEAMPIYCGNVLEAANRAE